MWVARGMLSYVVPDAASRRKRRKIETGVAKRTRTGKRQRLRFLDIFQKSLSMMLVLSFVLFAC